MSGDDAIPLRGFPCLRRLPVRVRTQTGARRGKQAHRVPLNAVAMMTDEHPPPRDPITLLLAALRSRAGVAFAWALAVGAASFAYYCRVQGTATVGTYVRSRVQLALAALGFSLAWALTPVAMALARRFKVLDIPDARKVHREPTPLLGGVAVWAALLVALAFSPNLAHHKQIAWIFVGGTIILTLGVLDDARGLPASFRLVVQVLATSLVMSQGVIVTFLPPTPLGRMGEALITVAWVVGIMNALNFLDGMDGLAAGLSAISAATFAFIANNTWQSDMVVLSTALTGAALGFLVFNAKPAKIFLGDAGSTFLGFMLASMAVLGTYRKTDAVIGLSIPILTLGIILYDFIHITISRVARGVVTNFREWIDYVGKDHLHHRLNQLGLDHRQTVLFIYLLSIFMGLSAVVLVTDSDIDKYLVMFMVVIMLTVMTVLMQLGREKKLPDEDVAPERPNTEAEPETGEPDQADG